MAIVALIVAGEAVFFLPFVLARVFRPTLLDLFQLTNLQLGVAFSVYGIVAMAAYFPSGPLADRFPPRKLIVTALALTSLGGLVMWSIPSFNTLRLLYAYWGVTTILLLWAPLISATRHWAGRAMPGRAFGFLDGGRGLVAATVGSLAVAIYAATLPSDVDTATPEQRATAFQVVILIFSAITFATCFLVWFGLPPERHTNQSIRKKLDRKEVIHVMTLPTVWLQSIIVVCAYAGYKGLDDISLYANEVFGLDEVDSAEVGAITLWMRPIAAVGAGLIADRWGVTKTTIASFVLLTLASGLMASSLLQPGMMAAFFLTLCATSAALFALRGLYFAIMEEGRVPFGYTGTAVGLVSVIGYTPDVFMGPVMGILLDRFPGASGHQYVFAVVTGFSVVGLACSICFAKQVIQAKLIDGANAGSSQKLE